MSLTEECEGYEQKRCRVNPFKKCTYCKNDSRFQDIAAAAGVALADLKIRDNIADSVWILKPFYLVLRLFSKRWCKKAYKLYPELKTVIEEFAEGQRFAETGQNCSLDQAAEPTAKAVGKIIEMLSPHDRYNTIFGTIGYCLGKWIYLCDTADDIERDIKRKNFNPLKAEINGGNPKIFAKERLTPIMNNCLAECRNYSELLEIKKYKSIIDNILYLGTNAQMEKIFKEEKDK
jgi:hypothetical protein